MSHEILNSSFEQYSNPIEQLFANLELTPKVYLSGGTINHGWVTVNKNLDQSILVVGPLLKGKEILSARSSGYLDQNKFIKASEATLKAKAVGVPVATFYNSGYLTTAEGNFAWGLQEVASGIPLSKVWDDLDYPRKVDLASKIGTFANKYQNIKRLDSADTPKNSKEWYLKRASDLLLDGTKLGVFTDEKALQIAKSFSKILDSVKINNTIGLIHGDLFQPNIYVDPKKPQNINAIIDWETAIIGHTGYENILSAWWFSGESGGSRHIFDTFISASSQNNNLGFSETDVYKAVALVDMFWRINVIVSCFAAGKTTDVPRWLNELETFLKSDFDSSKYANLK